MGKDDHITITDETAAEDGLKTSETTKELIDGKYESVEALIESKREAERKITELATQNADISRELSRKYSADLLNTEQPHGGKERTAEIDLTDPQQLASFLDERDKRIDQTLGNLADYAEIQAKNPNLSRDEIIKLMERGGTMSSADVVELEQLRKEKVEGTLGKTEVETTAEKIVNEVSKNLGDLPGGGTGDSEVQINPYDPDAYANLTDEQREKGLDESVDKDWKSMEEQGLTA